MTRETQRGGKPTGLMLDPLARFHLPLDFLDSVCDRGSERFSVSVIEYVNRTLVKDHFQSHLRHSNSCVP